MSSDPVREQQCLVEFSPAESLMVQWNWYDQIDGIQPWKCGEHQVGEGGHEGYLPFVLQQADRILERRCIGIQRPGSGIRRWTFNAEIAQMVGAIGGRH
jgi:hypothetical protein